MFTNCFRAAPPALRAAPLIALLGLPLAGFGSTLYRWKNVEIHGGGFVSGVLFHPAERDLVYTRTDVGGAFRWNAAAGRWIPLNDDLGMNDSQLTGVVSFAIDPNDASRLYLACGQYLPFWARTAAILRSSDHGATWSRTELSIKLGGNSDGRSNGERLQVDPNDGRVLYLGTNQDGLWRSTDSGVTWSPVGSFAPTSVSLVLFDRRTGSTGSPSQTIYAGVASTTTNNLYRSIDGGATWTPVPGQPTGVMPHHGEIAYDATGSLYLAYGNGPGPNSVTSGAVWKLNTTSGAWTNVTPAPAPPTAQGGFGGISIDVQNPQRLVVSTIDRWFPRDIIYLSSDGGATWADTTTTAIFDHSAAPWAQIRSIHWTGDVKLDPFNRDRVIFITGYGVYASTDLSRAATAQPVHWMFLNAGLEETVPLVVACPPTGAKMISALGDQGGFFHRDLDASPPFSDLFATHRGTTPGLDFAWLNPQVIARTHYDGTRGTYTLDGGTSWIDFATSPAPATANGPGAIAVAADGTRFVWMPERAGAYYSSNNGATWTASAGSPTNASNSFVPVADRVNALKFYIYDQTSGRVYFSANGGLSFTAGALLPSGGNAARTVPGHEGHVWVPVWDGGLRRSIDGGANFTTIASVQRGYRIGVGRAAPGGSYPALYLWGQVGGVEGFFRSDDEGATWTRLNDDAHRFGWINDLSGDWNTYGRVYLATGGRGIIYGDLAPALRDVEFTTFAAGAPGTYTPTFDTQLTVTFSATGLPSWAALNPATGAISGTPTDSPGTVHAIALTAKSAGETIGQSTVNLLVAAPGNGVRVANLSARAVVGTGDNILIPGFVIGGSGARTLLIRAVGPTLGAPPFNVPGTLADPMLTLVSGSTALLTNDNWEQATNLAALVAAMNTNTGFGFATGSKDAAALTTLAPGAYTVKTEGVAQTSGVALVELYDTTTAGASGGQLVNISARAVVGTGADVLIPGMIFEGGGATRVLIRAVGPTLGGVPFNVAGVLADPQLELYAGGTLLATNDDWGAASNADEIRAAAAAVFAFPLAEGGKDAVLLPTLVQGAYTVKVSGKNNATGVALVELYVVP